MSCLLHKTPQGSETVRKYYPRCLFVRFAQNLWHYMHKSFLLLPRVGFSVLFRKSTKNVGLAFFRVSVLGERKRHLCCSGVYVAFLYRSFGQPSPSKADGPDSYAYSDVVSFRGTGKFRKQQSFASAMDGVHILIYLYFPSQHSTVIS